MGLIKAFSGALTGTFADQWKDIITVDAFDEHVALMPGYNKSTNKGRGSNTKGSENIITNGSKIFVPENTSACIFSQAGLEDVVAEPGGYEYKDGTPTLFNGDGFKESIVKQTSKRMEYGGIPDEQKYVEYVNLREIRGIKYGTRGPLLYNDKFYGTDLEVKCFGSISLQIKDPIKFIQNFVPANMTYYSFDDKKAKDQLLSELLQSLIVAINKLSSEYRVSVLPGQSNSIKNILMNDTQNVGTWDDRFGLILTNIALENIELTDQSRELVRQYSENKMNVSAYDQVSQEASNIAAQQKIAQGIENNGMGDGAGMVFGMNFAQGLNSNVENLSNSVTTEADRQIAEINKFKQLLDNGILTQEEFDAKKKQILGI